METQRTPARHTPPAMPVAPQLEERTIAARLFRQLVSRIVPGAAGQAALLRELGVRAADLADVDARVPARTALRAWQLAERRSGDPSFGLHMAERIPFGAWGVLEYVVRSCPTVRDAARAAARYYRLVGSFDLELHEGHDWARITVHPPAGGSDDLPDGLRQANECVLASATLFGRQLRADGFPLTEVRFRHGPPADTSEHRRFFGAPLRWAQPENAIVFDARLLDAPAVSVDERAHAALDASAQSLLAEVGEGVPLIDRVRMVIASSLSQGVPEASVVARRLSVSERTLQRKLQEHGTSFGAIADEVRRDFAVMHLQRAQLSTSEIAFLLGFSQPRAFFRAFRRWTGRTPAEFRPG